MGVEGIPDCKIDRVEELLPWNCTPTADQGYIALTRQDGSAQRLPFTRSRERSLRSGRSELTG